MVALIFPLHIRAEKLYIVERDRSRLSVLEGGKKIGKIEGLGKLHHATVKFHRGFGYIISRDGILSKIHLGENRVVKQQKVGKSSIGLTFWKGWILVANYDPGTVVILTEELKIRKTVHTNSRTVGIKVWNDKILFALMDKDELWVLDGARNFEVFKTFQNVGKMPFDALLAGDVYILGFFKDPSLGVLDLKTFQLKKIFLKNDAGEVIFKIPHFGLWGRAGNRVFIPASKEKKIYFLSLEDLKLKGSIELSGFPVFAVVSPNKNLLAVNYSGPRENFLTLINLNTLKVQKTFSGGKRILHFRFSQKGEILYLSSYYENLVKIYSLSSGEWKEKIKVATPSGVFLVPHFYKRRP